MNVPVLLQVDRLSVKYGAVEAVADLSLAIHRGTVVSLVGPNGAGKSSLIGAVCGIVPKASGAVILNGQDVSSLPTHAIARQGVALVPEGRRLFPEMTVLDNLLTSGMFVQEARKRELLEGVYEHFPILRSRERQLARSLSGGEQQMLAIGRGLMADPQLLILDEPSLGLAPKLVRELFSVFRKLQEDRGHTILLVEQNVRQSLQIADYAYVLEGGRIFLEGSGSVVAANPHVRLAYLGVT